MFIGIIMDIGIVDQVQMCGDMWVCICCGYDMVGVDMGVLIVCDGVCLMVVQKGVDWFDVDILVEILFKINIGVNGWVVGCCLNFECVLCVGDEFGGYIVLGYVDGVVWIEKMYDEGDSMCVIFVVFDVLVWFIVEKGLVVLNGILLMVNEVVGNCFGVNLILYMQVVIIWGDVCEGDVVNLEIDIMVCYVVWLVEFV